MTDATQQKYEPGQHPDLPPPANLVGWPVWIWKNLFGTITNTALTAFSILLIYLIVPGALEFFIIDAVIFDGITVGELFLPSTYIEHGEGSVFRYILALLAIALAVGAVFYKNLPRRKLTRWIALPLVGFAIAMLTGDLALPIVDSRVACREIASGACWAVIVERFEVSIYFQYPDAERYRLNLAFILLFVALGPLLFDKFPARSKMIWFSAAFPFLAILLIVGPIEVESMHFSESTFGPIIWLLMFGGGLVLQYLAKARNQGSLYAIGILLAAVPVIVFCMSDLLWIIFPDALGITDESKDIFILEPVSTDKFGGIMLTIIIGVTGIAFSLPIGILLALGRVSNLPAMKAICVTFIEFIRGVPLIALLFVASTMLNYFLPPGTQFDLLLRVLIMVVFFASAYIAEVVRGGLQAIPKGQYEAADAMGLKYWQSMRLIVLPQALKISIPGIVNTFIGLYKDTTLVIIIGLFDLLGVMRNALSDPSWNGLSAEAYIYTAVFFFISCFAMSRYSLWLEKKLHTGHKR